MIEFCFLSFSPEGNVREGEAFPSSRQKTTCIVDLGEHYSADKGGAHTHTGHDGRAWH